MTREERTRFIARGVIAISVTIMVLSMVLGRKSFGGYAAFSLGLVALATLPIQSYRREGLAAAGALTLWSLAKWWLAQGAGG